MAGDLVWDKGTVGLGGAWRAQYELICHYENGHAPYTHSSWGDVRRHPRVRGYPTQKPVALLRELILQSSGPGALGVLRSRAHFVALSPGRAPAWMSRNAHVE